MIDALQIASSGLSANQAWIDTISNNVANMQTVGFKKSQVNFQNLVQPAGAGQSAPEAATPAVTGAGVETAPSRLVISPGSVRTTGGPLDVAIQGNGFFEVALSSGEVVFTRLGNFHVNAEGQLSLPDGEVLTADVRIPPDAAAVQIQPDGTVKATIAQTGEHIDAGKIRLASFAQAEGLEQMGKGLYRANKQSGDASYIEPGQEGAGLLLQGHLELSNVDLVGEMTDLVLAQRAYQLNARILQASDQILETINNIRR